jgi:hypothetical protein
MMHVGGDGCVHARKHGDAFVAWSKHERFVAVATDDFMAANAFEQRTCTIAQFCKYDHIGRIRIVGKLVDFEAICLEACPDAFDLEVRGAWGGLTCRS